MERKTFLGKWLYVVPLAALAIIASCSEGSKNPLAPDDAPAGGPLNQGVISTQVGTDIRADGIYDINGARWDALYTLKVGTGVIDPFLSVQADSVESGFNTDASPLPLDDTRSNFTDKLPLNNVPIFIEDNVLWREFIFEANEANSGDAANFSIERFDMYVCHDPTAPNYDALSDFTNNNLCTKVYAINTPTDHTSLLATDKATQGSGNDLDYRILIPAANFGSAANNACPYNPEGADCGYYLVLHVNIGGLGGIFKTGSTFEEFSTVKRAVPPILRVVKRVVNDNGGTATYANFNIVTSAGTLVFDGGVADGTSTIKYTAAPLQVDSGTYSLIEADIGGYTEGSWSCVGNAGPVVSTFGAGSVNLRPGEDVTCTITNNDIGPQLSLVKEVINDNGGTANASAWTLTATGTSGGFSGAGTPATGATATNGPNTVTAGVQYTLSESGGPSGYTAASAWVCTGGGTFVSPDKITLAVGETASCKIVNNDNAPQLSLVKEVVNDNGGTANASAWTLTATGSSAGFSGAGTPATGATATNGPHTVTAGVQYTLSESGGPSGYTAATNWVCTGTGGTFVAPDKITVALGGSVSCKIVNNDVAPQLSLVKEVINDNGGTANASAWTLTATGTSGGFSGAGSPATGATATNGPNNVTAGVQYTLSESGGPSGYTAASAWVCTGGGTFVSPDKITLAVGQTASCKIVNNDNPPGLTLVKEVVNDNGGTANASAWTLTATGTSGGFSGAGSPATGATASNGPHTVTAGVQYTLSESGGPSGYTAASAWVCTGTGGTFVSPDKITVALGGSVSCKIVNNDIAPQLSLVKEVINDNGGTANASAWTLTATGTSAGFSGAGSPATGATATNGPNNVTAGVQYTLSESGGPAGYTAASAWVCTGGGTFVSPNKITLALAETASCKIVNNDQPAKLTIVKYLTGASATFNFTGSGFGSGTFTLTPPSSVGSVAGVDSVIYDNLSIGLKTVTEGELAHYILTDVGCDNVAGDLTTRTASVTLALGQSSRCVFINNQQVSQTTRTQGFWQTHSNIAYYAWFGGDYQGNHFTGVAATSLGDTMLCSKNISTVEILMGGFWSNIAKTTTNAKRSALDQARMRLLQQLLAAELNYATFGSTPTGSISIQQAEDAYCGSDIDAINAAASAMAAFNESGDSGEFTPGVSANAKESRTTANLAFWNLLP
ncbi:MAG TPA: hypothetical protein VF042_15525 [Gemmatimonadaceae bacterium]